MDTGYFNLIDSISCCASNLEMFLVTQVGKT